jgi:signal transduction histidine kinase/CheY-like chemotaxis protein
MALVVVAEDNVDHQRLVAEVVRRLGHDVTVVGDGRAGLAAVARRRPDLVVTDIDMPHLDGLQMCRTLRDDPAFADIPIMLLTGYLPPSDPQLASVGATTVMTKPFSVHELTTVLRRQLGEDAPPGAAQVQSAPSDTSFVEALLDGLDVRVVTCDAEGRLTVRSRGASELFSGDGSTAGPVPLEEWTRRSRLRHHDGTLLRAEEMPLLRALAGEDVRGALVLDGDAGGQEHWLSINARPIRDAAGAVTGAVAAVHDVTTEHRARRFQDCTAEVLDVLSRSPDAVTLGDEVLRAVGTGVGWPYLRLWLVDPAGDVLRPAAAFLADDATPMPMPDSIARGEGLAGLCWQSGDLLWVPDVHAPGSPLLPQVVAAAAEYRAAGAVPLRSGDQVNGVLTFFSWSPQEPEPALAVLLRGIAGTIGAYLERRRAEELAVHLAAATDEYIALVGHELRTPLTSISAYTDLIAESPDETTIGEVRNLIEVIERNNGRLHTLIERLLDLAALESGHARLTTVDADLAEITTAGVAAITPVAQEHRITVDVHVPAGLTVPGDPRRLRQVVDSLLSNAVKFSPDDSTVTVTLAADGDLAVLTITDRGTGIPVAEQASMFRSLYRGRNAHRSGIPGAGLGLTLSRVLVERHHGTITLAPNRPTGTTVTVRIPRARHEGPVSSGD